MLKANEARARVEVLINEEREGIILKAKEFCETVVNEEIKKAVSEKKESIVVSCDKELREEAWKYLRTQGYVTYFCGHSSIDIRW